MKQYLLIGCFQDGGAPHQSMPSINRDMNSREEKIMDTHHSSILFPIIFKALAVELMNTT